MKELNLERSFRPEAFQTSISRMVRAGTNKILKDIHGKILDVGCGNGIFLLETVANYPEQLIPFGLDRDFAALDNARLVFSDNHFPAQRFVQGDAYQLPFGDNNFDAVFCLNTLVNLAPLATIEALIAELHRVCKPGHPFIFDYRNAWNPAITLTYRMNRLTGSVATFAYKWKHFKPVTTRLQARLINLLPLGSQNIFFAKGFLAILEK
ncbi:MAG TPA: class I SAM-dependent methyltransferase [Candidatus Marinimicrobia bacterium]|nr:class I SAM-dependent methyltransferase [Candidatus Neomarinimicrobiota bacterium]